MTVDRAEFGGRDRRAGDVRREDRHPDRHDHKHRRVLRRARTRASGGCSGGGAPRPVGVCAIGSARRARQAQLRRCADRQAVTSSPEIVLMTMCLHAVDDPRTESEGAERDRDTGPCSGAQARDTRRCGEGDGDRDQSAGEVVAGRCSRFGMHEGVIGDRDGDHCPWRSGRPGPHRSPRFAAARSTREPPGANHAGRRWRVQAPPEVADGEVCG